MCDIYSCVKIEDCLELLNRILELDYDTAYSLVQTQFQISEDLEEACWYDITLFLSDKESSPKLGMLGFLNGLFYNTSKIISANFQDGKLINFSIKSNP